jgi:hypothetical protein
VEIQEIVFHSLINRRTFMASTPELPQNPAQQDPSQAAPAQAQAPAPQPQQSDDATASTGAQVSDASLPNDGSKASINLHRAFSRLQERITKIADELGVRRSLTLPHVKTQSMDEHIQSIGDALKDRGGLTANLLSASHSKYGENGGVTVAHPADKLRNTVIPKDSAPAKAAISAAKSFIADAAKLLGDDDKTIQVAKSQVGLISKHDGEGMTVVDLMIALQNIPFPVIQSIARGHSGTKEGGHSAKRRPPQK